MFRYSNCLVLIFVNGGRGMYGINFLFPQYECQNILASFIKTLYFCQWSLICNASSAINHIFVLVFLGSLVCSSSLFFYGRSAAAAAKSLQSCPTLCDPIDGSPPDSSVPGIPQARTLEWVAISFSNEGKWKVRVKSLSRVWLLATLWTAAYQAPPVHGILQERVLEWVAIAFS